MLTYHFGYSRSSKSMTIVDVRADGTRRIVKMLDPATSRSLLVDIYTAQDAADTKAEADDVTQSLLSYAVDGSYRPARK